MTASHDPGGPPPRHPHELVWQCLRCGEILERGESIPAGCPRCAAPITELVLVEED